MTSIKKLSYYSLNGGAFKDRWVDQFRIAATIDTRVNHAGVDDEDDIPAAAVSVKLKR